MDNRIIMLVMAAMTFIAYPFLSADVRKQVSPLATEVDDLDDQDEMDEEGSTVMAEEDEEEELH